MTTACRRPRAMATAGLALLPLLSLPLAACGPRTHHGAVPSPSTPAASSSASPAASPSASPSPACPTTADIIAAANGTAGASGYQLSGLLACERGYATAEVIYPGAGQSIVVLHLVADRWQTAIMGSDVCSGAGDDGLKRPQWMIGAPDSVITAAHCQPATYHD